jgi:hypothetical protein
MKVEFSIKDNCPPNPNTVRSGDLLVLRPAGERGEGEPYLVAQVESNMVTLVCMQTGNRFLDPVRVESGSSPFPISKLLSGVLEEYSVRKASHIRLDIEVDTELGTPRNYPVSEEE